MKKIILTLVSFLLIVNGFSQTSLTPSNIVMGKLSDSTFEVYYFEIKYNEKVIHKEFIKSEYDANYVDLDYNIKFKSTLFSDKEIIELCNTYDFTLTNGYISKFISIGKYGTRAYEFYIFYDSWFGAKKNNYIDLGFPPYLIFEMKKKSF